MKVAPYLDTRIDAYSAGARPDRRAGRRKARLLAGGLLTAGAACAATGPVQAVIHYTADNTLVSAGNRTRFINLADANRFQIHFVSVVWSFPPEISTWRGVTVHNLARASSRVATAADYGRKFAPGDPIGTAAAPWQAGFLHLNRREHHLGPWGHSTPSLGPFVGSDGYIGVRFNTGSGTNEPKYGWIHYEGSSPGVSGIVHGWAWQDSGGTIYAGEAQ